MTAHPARPNERWVDPWSLTHLAWAFLLAMILPPFWALVIMVLWEPLEILVLSPLLARRGIVFGNESLRNSLVDLVVDVTGVAVAAFLVRPFWDPLGALF